MVDLGTGRLHTVGVTYVKQEDFLEMQADLKEQLDKQTTVLKQLLTAIRTGVLHLASISDEPIDEEDAKDTDE